MRANVYIISAPSGSGKTTLLHHLLKTFSDLRFSVSHTTRQPRSGELHGVDYFFTDRTGFQEMVGRGEFLEWTEYQGQLYGTARAYVEQQLNEGWDVILDIDVRGAHEVKSKIGEAIAIFLLPPSFMELERRLRTRMGESSTSDESIHHRLEIARAEIRYFKDYDYIVVNDVLDNSIQLLEAIVRSGHALPARQHERIEEIIASFGGTA
jgi:guanylate kinase